VVVVAAFLTVALAGGTGALAVFATGLAAGVTVVFILAVLMDAAGVPEAGAVDAVEVAPVDCCAVPLTGDIADYFAVITSFAMVANCMFEVPS